MEADTLTQLGWNAHWQALYDAADPPDHAVPARVVRDDGVAALVTTAEETLQVGIRRNNRPVVGDWVIVVNGGVTKVLPRQTLLKRKDPRADIPQSLAANVDRVLVTVPLDREIHHPVVAMALALAHDSGAEPTIVLTKADVVDDSQQAADTVRRAHPDTHVMTFSTQSDEGLRDVQQLVDRHTVVLLGKSGAGKSSLTNSLIGDEIALTGEVRERDAQGRHTTSARQLHLIPTGGVLIDSPGIRSFESWDTDDAVDTTFRDIVEIAEECRFANCKHITEPGCAIQIALTNGDLDQERVDAWMRVQVGVDEAATRALVTEYRNKKRRNS